MIKVKKTVGEVKIKKKKTGEKGRGKKGEKPPQKEKANFLCHD